MSLRGLLTPAQHELLRRAGVPALLPCGAEADRLEAGAQTTQQGGLERLVALRVTLPSDEPEPACPLEIQTIVREALLASVPPPERSETHDEAFMREYLEREAASSLAMRTLELAEGAALPACHP